MHHCKILIILKENYMLVSFKRDLIVIFTFRFRWICFVLHKSDHQEKLAIFLSIKGTLSYVRLLGIYMYRQYVSEIIRNIGDHPKSTMKQFKTCTNCNDNQFIREVEFFIFLLSKWISSLKTSQTSSSCKKIH